MSSAAGKDYEKLVHEFSNSHGTASDFMVLVVTAGYKVTPKKLPVHKVVLENESPVFAAMLNTPGTLEAEQNAILIVDFDEHVVAAMLTYLYKKSVDENVLNTHAAELLQIADKYFVDALRDECEKAVANRLDIHNVMELFILADFHNRNWLKDKTMNFIVTNQKLVETTNAYQMVCTQWPTLIQEIVRYSV